MSPVGQALVAAFWIGLPAFVVYRLWRRWRRAPSQAREDVSNAVYVIAGVALLLVGMYVLDSCTGALSEMIPWRTPANSNLPGVSCYEQYDDWFAEQVELHGGVPEGLVYDPQAACSR